MAFPLIPFAAGVAVGSLATYGATDKALQQRIAQMTGKAVTRVKATGAKLAESLPALGRTTKEKAAAECAAAQP